MILSKGAATTHGAGSRLEFAVILKSRFKGGDNIAANEQWKDANDFEQWCREQGLLVEINDADYVEPKLAVVS